MIVKKTVFFIGMFLCFIGLTACGRKEEEEASSQTEFTIDIATEEIQTTEEVTKEIVDFKTTTEKPATEEEKDERIYMLLQNCMEKRTFEADCSISVMELDTKTETVIDNHSMQAASLIKLYIAGAVYENINKGLIEKTDNTETLISKMISASDNDSANQLVALLGNDDVVLGMQRVNDYCAVHGFSDTHMGRLLLAANDEDDNFTSVCDVTGFLSMLYDGKLAGSNTILSYMKKQERISKLPAGIPSGIVTGNKTGELADVENDAMIVFKDEKPYIICIMCQYVNDTNMARAWMTGVSSSVYEYNVSGTPELFDAG